MQLQKIIRYWPLCLALATMGCRDTLDVTPISVANVNAFYKTSQDAVVATNAAYNPLQDIHRQLMWEFAEVMSDNTEDNSARSLDNFTYDPADGRISSLWQNHYLGIARCNTVLDRLPGIPMNAELRNRLLLEARFLRGFYYFNLVRFYGGVPLVLNEITTLDAARPVRASVEAVYAQIIADLTAAEGLPAQYPDSEKGRATQGAAKALLAKVHLTRRDWALAAAKAQEVRALGVYALLPDYADVFRAQFRNSAESVFEVQFFIGAQSGTGNFLGNNFYELFAPAGSAALVTGVVGSNGLGRNIPTNNLADAYESGDPRRPLSLDTAFVRPPSDTVVVNFIRKHLDPTAVGAGGGGSFGSGSQNGWRVVRFADVLLMHAEALNELGNTGAALEAVNLVRQRARGGASPLTVLPDLAGLDQAALREAIFRERRVELAFENHRWLDLVRTGRALEVLGNPPNNKPIQLRNLLLPIPQREIDINPALVQNPGY